MSNRIMNLQNLPNLLSDSAAPMNLTTPRRLVKWLTRVTLMLGIAVGVFSGVQWLGAKPAISSQAVRLVSTNGQAGKQEAPDLLMEPLVETIRLSAEDDSFLPRSFTGVVAARRASDLAFKRAGRVEKVLVDQGEKVVTGQVLAELDTASLKANLAVVQAQRNAADARLRELVAGPRRQTIEAARAQVKEMEALRELAFTTFDRRMKLAASDAISKQDIDDSRLQLAANEGRLDAQRQVLSELEEGTRKEQIVAQEAAVKQLDANIEALQIELQESTLLAPYDAIISRRLADEGVVVQPGATVLKIVELAQPEAWIGITPEMISSVRIGDEYTVRIRDEAWTGTVKGFLPELDPLSRTQTVIFDIAPSTQSKGDDDSSVNSPESIPVIGQLAQLDLKQKVTQKGFWLPMTALLRGNRGLWSTFVVVPHENSDEGSSRHVIQRCDVEIVQVDSDRVLVRGTLSDGDRVVATGLQKLTAGQLVRLAPPQRTPLTHLSH
jgi:multidrug efflux pump subunit AcrA (membrane-fusion protein)